MLAFEKGSLRDLPATFIPDDGAIVSVLHAGAVLHTTVFMPYFCKQNCSRSCLLGDMPSSTPQWICLLGRTRSNSCILLISSGPHHSRPVQFFTFERCEPRPRCTSAHGAQRNTPRFTLAQVLSARPQSAQRTLCDSARNVLSVFMCKVSRPSMSSRGNSPPSLLRHIGAMVLHGQTKQRVVAN